MARLWNAYKETYSGLPRSAWLLALAQFVNASGTMVVFFLTLYLTTKLNFGLERAGAAMSVYGLGMLAGTLVGGALSDRLGAHRVQRYSLVASGLCLATLSLLSSYAWILAVTLLWGFCAAALYPANASALAAVCTDALRPKGFVLLRLANNLGATIGPVAGGILARHDYRYLFWVDAATCLMAALAFFAFFRGKAPRPQAATADGRRVAWWRDGPLLAVLLSGLGMALVFAQLFSTWGPYLKESNGLDEPSIGLLMAVNTLLIVLFQMPLIHAVQRLSGTAVSAAGAVLIALGFGLLDLGHGWVYLACTVVVWTVGEMLTFPTLSAMVSLRASGSTQGKYQGLYSLAFSLGIVAGPVAGARLGEAAGWGALWASTCALGLAVAALLSALALRWDGRK